MLRYKALFEKELAWLIKVNATKIQAALKGHKGIVTNVDELEVYLIHGIYGHA
jgi:hypothetical protein